MERKTSTTLGELKLGDRFYFVSDSKKKAHCVMNTASKAVYYNIIHANGSRHWQYDRMASPEKKVIFLRHKND